MTSHSRSLSWLVAVVLATIPSLTLAQDSPLYRDPSPMEGPRIDGPLLAPLSPRTSSTPPPPSSLGPFQPSNPGNAPASEPVREPLLVVQPIPTPLPAMPSPFMQPVEVQIRRKTTIRPPDGPISRCHQWFREALFGPPKPTTFTTIDPSKPSFFASLFHPLPPEGEAPKSLFHWPSWPSWPLSGDH